MTPAMIMMATVATVVVASKNVSDQVNLLVENDDGGRKWNYHQRFLLLSTVNSIRFWSVDCPIHRSWSAYVNASRLAYQTSDGITGLAVYTRGRFRFLFWYDVPARQLYYASIEQNDNEPCVSGQLQLGTIVPVPIPGARHEKFPDHFVRLAISSADHRLFMFDVIGNRIEMYHIITAEQTPQPKFELGLLKSYPTQHPTSPTVDEDHHRLFWIESWSRFCWLDYRAPEWKKQCAVNGKAQKPQTMAFAGQETIFWAQKPNRIMVTTTTSGDDFFKNSAKLLFQLPESVTTMVGRMVWDDHGQRLFLQDERDVIMMPVASNPVTETTVLIESQPIFEMIFVSFDSNSRSPPGTGDSAGFKHGSFLPEGWFLLYAVIVSVAMLVLAILYLVIRQIKSHEPKPFFPWSDRDLDDCAKLVGPLPSEKEFDNRKKIIKIDKMKKTKPKMATSCKQNDSSDIEDLISATATCIENPFVPCRSCPEPEHCASMQLCTFKFQA